MSASTWIDADGEIVVNNYGPMSICDAHSGNTRTLTCPECGNTDKLCLTGRPGKAHPVRYCPCGRESPVPLLTGWDLEAIANAIRSSTDAVNPMPNFTLSESGSWDLEVPLVNGVAFARGKGAF